VKNASLIDMEGTESLSPSLIMRNVYVSEPSRLLTRGGEAFGPGSGGRRVAHLKVLLS